MPTRRLEVEIIGDDRSLQRAYGRAARSTPLLERHFGAVGRAGQTAFSRIGSAARTATPYISAGLVLGLGEAVAEAREAEKAGRQTAAVIDSMGGAANVTRKHVESLAEAISQQAGIDDEAVQSAENLLLTFGNIRNEVGRGNKVFDRSIQITADLAARFDQDLNRSAIMVGKALNDPIAGLTSLGRVGVQFTDQQKEQIATLVESGKTLQAQKIIMGELERQTKGAARAEADAIDRIKVVAENLAEDIGLKILPTVEDLATEVSDILSDKNLTAEQKAGRLSELLQERLGDAIEGIADVAPEFAAAGGKLGVKMIGGFAEAWWESDILGKLFLAGGLIRLLGGPGAFAKVGGYIGGKLSRRLATTVATETAASAASGSLFGDLAGASGRRGAGSVGAKLGRWLGIGAVAAGAAYVATHWDEVGNAIDPQDGFGPLRGTSREEFADMLGQQPGFDVTGFIGRNRVRVHTALGDLIFNSETRRIVRVRGKQLERFVGRTYDEALGDINVALTNRGLRPLKLPPMNTKAVERSLDRLRSLTDSKFGDMYGISRRQLGKIERLLKTSPERGRKALAAAYDRATASINRAMDEGRISTKNGMRRIEDLMNAKLALFGFKGGISEALRAVIDPKTGLPPVLKQRGGLIVGGTGSGDKVPILAEPGEVVWNREAVAAMGGPAAADRVNRTFPRFQQGGRVPRTDDYRLPRWTSDYFPGVIGAKGLNTTAAAGERILKRAARGSVSAEWKSIDALARKLGLSATSTFRPGDDGFHGSRQAKDYADGPAQMFRFATTLARSIGPKLLELIYTPLGYSYDNFHRTAPFAQADHYDHVHVALASRYQRGGRVRGNLGGLNRRFGWDSTEAIAPWQAAAIAERAGLPGWTFAQIAHGESAFQPGAVGHDPGGTMGLGLWQITTQYNDDIIARFGGRSAMLNPWNNARAAKAIYERQGIGAWYGTRYLTDRNKHYTGKEFMPVTAEEALATHKKPFKTARDAKNYLRKFGITGEVAVRAAQAAAAPRGGGGGGGGGRAPGGGSGSPAGLGGGLSGPGMTYEDQVAMLDIASAMAEGTPDTADDLAAIQARIGFFSARDSEVVARIKQLNRRIGQGKGVGKPPKRRKGESAKDYRKRLAQWRRGAVEQRSELLGEHGSLLSDINALQGELGGATDTADIASLLTEIRDELKTQRLREEQTGAVAKSEITRALADLLSGELGWMSERRAQTAGSGSVSRF